MDHQPAHHSRWCTLLTVVLASCGGPDKNQMGQDGGPDFSTDGGIEMPPMPTNFAIELVPDGVAGNQRVNFAIPLAAGTLSDENAVRVIVANAEVPVARRALARYT